MMKSENPVAGNLFSCAEIVDFGCSGFGEGVKVGSGLGDPIEAGVGDGVCVAGDGEACGTSIIFSAISSLLRNTRAIFSLFE